jgi:hypothetical protein
MKESRNVNVRKAEAFYKPRCNEQASGSASLRLLPPRHVSDAVPVSGCKA